MSISKKVLLDTNVLLEWVYDDNNSKSIDYSILTNLNDDSKSYMAKAGLNTIDNTLFVVDSVLKRYAKVNLNNFNYLHKQDYAGYYIPHDTINIYFPTSYNFPTYYGFNLNVYTLNYTNSKIHSISNFFYDRTTDNNIGKLGLVSPFTFNEQSWGKCITFDVPSIYNIAKERLVTSNSNTVVSNTINYNLTNTVGLSQTTPIFIDFSWITSITELLNNTYYTLGDTYEASLPQQPEYQSLGVEIVESTQGDYFEIYGIYQGTNELIDNFISDLEASGKKIEIQYEITLYEAGVQSGYPITMVIDDNFAQKILYRPIIRYSNTTAAIDVTMKIIDTAFNSQIERTASIGITKNIFKYGKTLNSINLSNSVIKTKIYKAPPATIVMNNPTIAGSNSSGTTASATASITKVPYPVLYDKYKILVNSTNSINSDYKTMGLLNIILTPFDNVIKFTIAKSLNTTTNTPTAYDLSEFSNNASLKLVFKSDGKILEKSYYVQSSDNDLKNGVILYKIDQTDLSTIKEIYNSGFKNFYLTIYANDTKSQLYSGKYEFYENVKFVNNTTTSTSTSTSTTTTSGTTNSGYTADTTILSGDTVNKTTDVLSSSVKTVNIDKQVSSNSAFNKSNIPLTQPSASIQSNKNYFNLMVFAKKNIVLKTLQSEFNGLGINSWIYNDYVYYLSGIHVLTVQKIEKLTTLIKTVIRIDIYAGQTAAKSNGSVTNTTISESQISSLISEINSNTNTTTSSTVTYLDPTSGKITTNSGGTTA